MTAHGVRNTPASIAARLLNQARSRGEDYGFTLSQYGIDGALRRIAASRHRERFVLKGATLFAVWLPNIHRATWDLDLLGTGSESIMEMEAVFREILGTSVEEDGLTFDIEGLGGEEIRAEEEHKGVRLDTTALLGRTRIPLRIDIGLDDIVIPKPAWEYVPAALGHSPARLLVYPREAVVAEKLEAMLARGMKNSRMKDYFDIQFLASRFDFKGAILSDSIGATLKRRKTGIIEGVPFGLSDDFARMPERIPQWRAFVKRARIPADTSDLAGIVNRVRTFVLPPFNAAQDRRRFESSWPAGGPWQ